MCRTLQWLHSTQCEIRLRAKWMLHHSHFWSLDCLWIVTLAVSLYEGACSAQPLSDWVTLCYFFLSLSPVPSHAFLQHIHKAPGLSKCFVQAETFWNPAQMALCELVLPQGKSYLIVSFDFPKIVVHLRFILRSTWTRSGDTELYFKKRDFMTNLVNWDYFILVTIN